MNTTSISLKDVTKVYNAGLPDELVVLEDISLDIRKDTMVVLKGPSGSGKTTLLSVIGCMARPTAGSVIVGSRDVARLPERFLSEMRRTSYGFIFQQFNLIRDLSVLDNVLLPLYPSSLPLADMKLRAGRILADLKMDHKTRLPVRKLSGGEQQRVAIARALITEPEIVIADEPTAHLDPDLSREMMAVLLSLRDRGTTVLIATHDPFVYEHEGVDGVIVMRNGRVKEILSP